MRGLGEQPLRKMFLVCYFTGITNKSQFLMAVETGGKDSVLLHVQHPSGKKAVERGQWRGEEPAPGSKGFLGDGDKIFGVKSFIQ